MRVDRVALSFAIILASSPRLSSQQSVATPQRDPQAVAAVQQAIATLGGTTNLSTILDSVAAGNIAPTSGSSIGQASFVWKDSGTEFRRQTSTGTTSQILVSGHGHPSVTSGGSTQKLFYHMTHTTPPFYIPGLVLLRELSDTRYSLLFVGSASVGGRSAIHVRSTLETDSLTANVTSQDWFLDSATSLPLRVEYRLPSTSNEADLLAAAAEFSDFRQIASVLVPFRIAAYHEGEPISIVTLTSVIFNNGLSAAEFDAPGGR